MSLRIAFDLDGTVADMLTVLRQEAEQLFGEDTLSRQTYQVRDTPSAGPDEDPDNPAMAELHLTPRQQMQLWDHVRQIDNFWLKLAETESGIIARIATVAYRRRWEVIFITTRPASAGETVQLQSAQWLDAHGFALPSVFVVHGSRGKVAEALGLDFVVDDRPDNCLDVAVDSKAKAILIWPDDPNKLPAGARRLGIRPAATIGEAVDLIEKYDDLRNEGGVVNSIKRFFGREQPS
ncbi:MAG: hypothetical protein AB7O67_13045 [Vicinamibacterales bacterium]